MRKVLLLLVLMMPSVIYAVNIRVPTTDPDGIITDPQPSQIQADSNIFRDTIQFINEYLRIALIVVAFGVLVYTGFTLMSSPSEDGIKKLGKTFVSVLGGILIAIFAYVFISLLANLF